ncbi:MAG: hypothetical protein QME52_04500 [Bacteroidota bacterium]|nr:hypothetical protein [Bacteroidota bacterium]
MYFALPYLIIYLGLVALGIYIRFFIRSTVEKSIGHQFDLKLEKFKQDFAKEMTALERKDKYRLAALDKRLKTHQLAFGLGIEMIHHLYDKTDERIEIIKKLDNFWKNNSLYLTNKTRNAFKNCYDYYQMNPILIEAWRTTHKEEHYKQLEERFDYFLKLPKIIAEEVDLEAMGNENLLVDGRRITPLGIEDKKEENS